ncbi:hypothetical protein ONZ45_g9342 [Pleurotus djamor]|nr:hypothetical protein ONZ45_g9342 [Pleurotus djamor]
MGFRLSEPSFIMAFRYLPSRTPNLTHLSLISTVDYSVNLAATVIEVISLLRCLKTFQAPNSLLTSDITSALFSLPSLETIQVVQAHALNDKGAYLPTKYNADEQQFSSLQKLQLDIPFGRFVDWLSLIRSHRSLSTIKINSIIPQTSEQYRTLICACVKTCPALQVLHLTVEHPTPTENNSFDFSHIEPLLQCSDLKEFHVQHYSPLEVTSNQLCSFVEQLRCLEVLSLNPSPDAGSRVGSSLMDLSALQTMIPYCPNLTKLSLLMNGASVPKPTLQLHGGFPKLKSLDLGCSPCGSVDQLAAFLSAVLPSGCKITGDRSKWETVGKFMPTFHQVRMEERLRLSLTASS